VNNHTASRVQLLLDRFGLNDSYISTEISRTIGMRLRRIPIVFFGNRMVIILSESEPETYLSKLRILHLPYQYLVQENSQSTDVINNKKS